MGRLGFLSGAFPGRSHRPGNVTAHRIRRDDKLTNIPGGNGAEIPPYLSRYPKMPDQRAESPRTPVDAEYFAELFTNMRKHLNDLTGLIEDTSHRVDEYQVMPLTGAGGITQLTLTPDYDTYPEIITAVLVTGPATTAFTVNLGKRAWTLQTNAQGFVILAPLKLSLGRFDQRVLNSITAGAWSLELMGHADIGYRYK